MLLLLLLPLIGRGIFASAGSTGCATSGDTPPEDAAALEAAAPLYFQLTSTNCTPISMPMLRRRMPSDNLRRIIAMFAVLSSSQVEVRNSALTFATLAVLSRVPRFFLPHCSK